MNIENTRSHFGFIGFGLIGGSIAHALRELYPSSHIMAYNYYIEKPHPMLELAKKDGVLSSICTDLSAFSECDVIFLCAPVIKNAMYLKQLAPCKRMSDHRCRKCQRKYLSDSCFTWIRRTICWRTSDDRFGKYRLYIFLF